MQLNFKTDCELQRLFNNTTQVIIAACIQVSCKRMFLRLVILGLLHDQTASNFFILVAVEIHIIWDRRDWWVISWTDAAVLSTSVDVTGMVPTASFNASSPSGSCMPSASVQSQNPDWAAAKSMPSLPRSILNFRNSSGQGLVTSRGHVWASNMLTPPRNWRKVTQTGQWAINTG